MSDKNDYVNSLVRTVLTLRYTPHYPRGSQISTDRCVLDWNPDEDYYDAKISSILVAEEPMLCQY